MNTQKLKELFAEWQSAKVDSHYPTITFEESDMLEAYFSALTDRLEAAERERDELRAEQAEHDEQIARMESKFSLAKRALDSKTARCEKAEAELRRRDAAAGEPDGYIFCHPSGKNFWSVSHDDTAGHNGVKPFYFAAQPAVLPDIDGYTHGLFPHAVEQLTRFRDDALALGAQQQKVVELPEPVKWPEIPFKYFSEEQVFSMLDAAGVKWEVKK